MQSKASVTKFQGTKAQPYSQGVLGSQEYQDFKQRVQQQVAGMLTPGADMVSSPRRWAL